MDRKLIIHQFFSLLSNGAPAVMALVAFRMLNDSLGVDTFGVYILVVAAYGIFVQLRAGIISAAFIKLASGKIFSRVLIGSSWVVSFILSAAFILFLVGFTVFTNLNAKILLPMALLALISIPTFMASTVFQSKEIFNGIALLRIIESGLFLSGLLFLKADISEAHHALWLLCTAAGLTSITVLVLGWARPQNLMRASMEKMIEIWHFGKFTSGTQIITSLIVNTDIFLIQIFLGNAAVTYFEIGRKWLEVFEVPFRSLSSVYYSRVSGMINNGQQSSLWAFITSRAIRTTAIALLFVPGFYFFAPQLILLLAGEGYGESIEVFRILLVLPLLIPMDRFFGLSLDALGKPKLNFLKGIILLSLNFLLDLVILKMGHGISGVALVSIGFYLVGGLLSVFWLYRSIKE